MYNKTVNNRQQDQQASRVEPLHHKLSRVLSRVQFRLSVLLPLLVLLPVLESDNTRWTQGGSTNKNKDQGNKVAVLSTDLSSAYDTVEHKLLLAKLEHLGFRNKTYKLFESYLSERKFYTEVQGFTSNLKEIPGVSIVQGSKMSSLL